MPIHLAPISRRRFLARTLAAGGGLMLAQELFAKTKALDKNLWIFLSDTHLSLDRAKVERGVNMTDHFEQVSKEVLELPKRGAGLFLMGDCAFSSGQKGDYAVLQELLEPIRASQTPVYLALGNHDNREQFWEVLSAEKERKRPLADRQVAFLPGTRANWFILDSLEKTLQTPGLLGKEQLEWLGRTLDENPTKPAIVLIHHNPGISGNMGLKDTVALFEVIRPRKQVKAYFYGHTHAWSVQQDESGIHMINLPPVSYLFHEGDPAGWVQAKLQTDGIELELRCVDKIHKAHGERHALKWRA